MKNSKSYLLISTGFVISILVLLLNDFYLKAEFHNWFTGKLSDFAGLFAFSLFFLAFFEKRSKLVLWVIGLSFILWKSSLSEGFIEIWNSLAPFNIARVVDYTDLMALVVIPLAYLYAKKAAEWSNHKIAKRVAFSLAIFAFMATSKPDDYPIEPQAIDLNVEYVLDFPIEEILERLAELNLVEVNLTTNPSSGLEELYIITGWVNCSGEILFASTISSTTDNKTLLKLETGTSYCSEGSFNADTFIDIFETEVINKLN